MQRTGSQSGLLQITLLLESKIQDGAGQNDKIEASKQPFMNQRVPGNGGLSLWLMAVHLKFLFHKWTDISTSFPHCLFVEFLFQLSLNNLLWGNVTRLGGSHFVSTTAWIGSTCNRFLMKIFLTCIKQKYLCGFARLGSWTSRLLSLAPAGAHTKAASVFYFVNHLRIKLTSQVWHRDVSGSSALSADTVALLILFCVPAALA